MIEAGKFATTFVGTYLLPLLVMLTFSILVAGAKAISNIFRAIKDQAAETKKEVALQNEITRKTLAEQNEVLAIIKHEVMPNNGSSMKDSLHRIEAIQIADHQQLVDHIAATKEGK